MNRFVTITTFTFAHEVLVLRGRLESEGIQCFVPDEQTIQMHPFYSNALGGLRLQVLEKDFEKAATILKEGGYEVEMNSFEKLTDSGDDITDNENVSNKKRSKRIVVWVIVVLFFVLLVMKLLSMKKEVGHQDLVFQLIDYKWCVLRVQSGIVELKPNTSSLKLSLNDNSFCREEINFMDGGVLLLPGFNSPQINGYWYFVEDSLQIIRCDTMGEIFNNAYSIQENGDKIILKSDNTIISCERSTRK